jgi:hypothetical protein
MQFDTYKEHLIARCFKIIPMIEEKIESLPSYIQSLIYELEGISSLENSKNVFSSEYVSLLGTLHSIHSEVCCKSINFKRVRSEVFKCIGLVKSMEIIQMIVKEES